MDWRDHPEKTQEWYDIERARYERNGVLHLFAQEVDRDASAAVEGVIIPDLWVKSAINAHVRLNFKGDGASTAALDVADEGGDRNSYAQRKGVILKYLASWAEGDTGQTARKAVILSKARAVSELQYDPIGVGAGVKAETNRMKVDGSLTKHFKITQWHAGHNPLHPERHILLDENGKQDIHSPKNKDFYRNLKAQGWWELRLRFEKTYKAIKHKNEHPEKELLYPEEELISIPSDLDEFHELIMELSQPTYGDNGKGQLIVNKKPDGTKSPNRADSVMMLMWPEDRTFVAGPLLGVR